MEILTNKFGLPETLVRAASRDEHVTKGTISVTQLIDSPQVRILRKNNDYEVDVSDKLSALLGTAIHHIIEYSDKDYQNKKAIIKTAEVLIKKARELANGEFAEQAAGMNRAADYLFQIVSWLFPEPHQRYMYETTMSLDLGEGHVLSGTADLYDKHLKTLYDYKSCTVFQYMYPDARKKWEEQANIYALMLEVLFNVKVEKIRIVAMFKDFSKFDRIRMKGYPPRQTMEIDIFRRSNEDIWQMIIANRDRHILAEQKGFLECNGKERWAISDEYAIKKPGKKRAIAKYPTVDLANKALQESLHLKEMKGAFIELRPGTSKRCENYCDVSEICHQYAKEKAIKAQIAGADKEEQENEFD